MLIITFLSLVCLLHTHSHVITYAYTLYTVSPDNATVAVFLWCEK
jgi:hypothetical protein